MTPLATLTMVLLVQVADECGMFLEESPANSREADANSFHTFAFRKMQLFYQQANGASP